MKILKKYWAKILLTLSVATILIALIAEYIFKIIPCEMCIYQRYPYYFIILFSLAYIIVKKISGIWYYRIIFISLLIGLFLSLWHVGVEQKILSGLSGCSNKINALESLSQLKEQIINQNVVTCSEITWSIMGISAATLNSLLLSLLLLINTLLLFSYYLEKKNKKIN